MSRIIPQPLVNVLRQQADISVSLYGIDCLLFIPSNISEVEPLDGYEKPQDYRYNVYSAMVYVEWNPSIHRLKKLGIFAEDETPILCRFASTAKDEKGNIVPVEIVPRSFVRIPIQYVPKQIDTDEFEIIDVHIEGLHDAVSLKLWKLAPRRVKK